MAASILVEEEQGTYSRSPHPHNGYYAGDFRATDGAEPSPSSYPPRSALTFTVR